MTLLLASHASAGEDRYLADRPQFTLPFHVFNGHMLIDGAVNGVAGKFLFDTGTEFPFFLNNHFLALSKDHLLGRGHAGSGQEMVLYTQDAPLQTIELAGQIHFENVAAPIHTDWGFFEQAYSLSSFLGSLGHGFNQNYIFVIDYEAQTIVFHAYNEDAQLLAHVIDPARVIATFAFTATGVDGKMPEITLRIGHEDIGAYFDTGNQGSLELTEATKNALLSQGYLRLESSEYLYGTHEPHIRATLKGLHHGHQRLQDGRNLLFQTGSQNRLGLGYQFLKNYITVWDYKHQRLTLLRP